MATLVYLTNDYGLIDENGNVYYTKDAYLVPGTSFTNTSHGKAGYYCGRWIGTDADYKPIRYYKMTADLDMSGYDFNKGGIGACNDSTAFYGSFDGDGHVIKNWKSTSSGSVGMNGIFTWARFANVDGQGIKNVGVENADIKCDSWIGGILIGRLDALGTEDSSVENCYVKDSTVSVERDNSMNGMSAGVIAGYMRYDRTNTKTTIKNCYVYNSDAWYYFNNRYLRWGYEHGSIVGKDSVNGGDTYTHSVALENCYAMGRSDRAGRQFKITDGLSKCTATITNCFYLDSNDATTWTNQGTGESGITLTAAALGSAYMEDVLGLNGGLPVFSGEYEYITNTVADCENGSINVTEKAGEVKKNGNTVYIKKNSGLTVTAEPKDEGYVLESVAYNGNDKTSSFVSGSATFAYSDLTDNAQWSASDGKTLVLPAVGNKDGAYAICVYGEGVKTGSFTMQPYMKVSEGGETITGDATSIFSLED